MTGLSGCSISSYLLANFGLLLTKASALLDLFLEWDVSQLLESELVDMGVRGSDMSSKSSKVVEDRGDEGSEKAGE